MISHAASSHTQICLPKPRGNGLQAIYNSQTFDTNASGNVFKSWAFGRQKTHPASLNSLLLANSRKT